MLESCQTAQERWGGVHELIDRWLEERRQLLVSYYRLTKALADQGKTSTEALEGFREWLTDYLSAGHFEIYEQLMKEAQAFGDQPALVLLDQALPKLHTLTHQLMDLDSQLNPAALQRLESNLSQIGELLAERFDIEDQLIEKLHSAHA